jgi:hypothetical protein
MLVNFSKMSNKEFTGMHSHNMQDGIFFVQNTEDHRGSYTNEGHIFHDIHNG